MQKKRSQAQWQKAQNDDSEVKTLDKLDSNVFTQCLKLAPRGGSAWPGGMSYELLRVCLDEESLLQDLLAVATALARAEVPPDASKSKDNASKDDGAQRTRGRRERQSYKHGVEALGGRLGPKLAPPPALRCFAVRPTMVSTR